MNGRLRCGMGWTGVVLAVDGRGVWQVARLGAGDA